MAYPTGLALVTVTAGSAFNFAGTDQPITVSIKPVLGGNAVRLIWAATGQLVVDGTVEYKAEAGSLVSFTVPNPDQPGFINGAGAAARNWSYVATVKVGGYEWKQAFQPVAGQTFVDLDLVPDGQVTAPTSAPLPQVVSVNGQTGAVELDTGGDASDAAIAALVADPLSATRAEVADLVADPVPGPTGPTGPPGLIILNPGDPVPDPQIPGVLYGWLLEAVVETAPTVLTHPQNLTVEDGQNAQFQSTASGYPTPAVQWQQNSTGSWADISGATSGILTVAASSAIDGRQYRAVWTNSEGTATSNPATLTVTAEPVAPPTVTVHPSNQSVTEGTPVTFTADATGDDSAQWQVSTGGAWNNIAGETAASLTLTPALSQNGYLYRCGFTNGGGTTYTNPATLTVTAAPVEETLAFEDLFNRANGPIASPWTIGSGTDVVIDNNALRVNASGFHRVTPGAYAAPLRVEGTIVGPILRFTGLYLGRSTTDPVTYPGIKVLTSQAALGFSLTSAETVFGTTLDNLADLTAAALGDESVGGTLAIEWDGTQLAYFWNGQPVDVTTGANLTAAAALIAPGAGLVGIAGSSPTSSRWDSFRVWSL